jgi:PPOX class probable F420-dependent enzyme
MATMTVDEIRAFVRQHHRCVIVTHRSDDQLHVSPVVCGVADDGRIAISITETRAKTRHLRRDPRATLCVFTDAFFGPWIQVDGTAELVPMPHALEGLRALYRQVQGEHPNWSDFDRAMATDQRVLCLVAIVG